MAIILRRLHISERCVVTKTNLSSNNFAISLSFACLKSKANYSRRSDQNQDSSFKVVKSKVRIENDADGFTGEGGPNWELLAPKGNRFYFPNAIGPAWQGASTTIHLEAPLEALVDIRGKKSHKGQQNKLLQLFIGDCPSLIKKALHELFPAPEVVSSDKIALMTLRFSGDNEQGASKFVLAAREITARLRLHGYWADFMNPFSGKPFYSWANGKNLYKVDNRFRGFNMRLTTHNHCVLISSEDSEKIFSGAIYTNAPSNQVKALIDEQV